MRSHTPPPVVSIGFVCVLAVMAVSVIVGAKTALGQDQPKAPAVTEGEREGAPRAERRDRPEAEWRERRERGDEARRLQETRERRAVAEMMMARQMPAIAVADGKVFVVFGGVLYKFDAETLALEGQQRLPRPPAPPFAARPGREGRPQRPPAQGPAQEEN